MLGTSMLIRQPLLLVALGACGGTYYGTLPLGWHGTIPTCDSAQVVRGSAVVVESTGFLSAAHEGRATLRCKGGDEAGVGVARVARLALEGETAIPLGSFSGYWLRAYDADGRELSFAEPALDLVEWSTSWVESDARIERAYCHEPIFGCPASNFARLTVTRAGTVTVRARFAGQTAQLDVAVRE